VNIYRILWIDRSSYYIVRGGAVVGVVVAVVSVVAVVVVVSEYIYIWSSCMDKFVLLNVCVCVRENRQCRGS